ncbi:MAG: dihydrolipoyl dehydrogenase family protein [Rhodospirillaceae bacterium]
MNNALKPDLCIIGAGSGGLAVAAGAAQMGASVVLIEQDKMGGDCLNTGCIPSKALLAAGKCASLPKSTYPFGIKSQIPTVDFQAVHNHISEVIAGIAPHDSVERFEGLGVKVIHGTAAFISKREVLVNGQTVRARRFVVATGSSPVVPQIDGLTDTPYLTNASVFDLTEEPYHLIVIGGGPMGCELAQAYRNLGCQVTIIEAFSILNKEDPDLVAVVRASLTCQGVTIIEGARVLRTEKKAFGIAISIERGGTTEIIEGSHLLVAVGRRARVEDLCLEAATIKCSAKGIDVDAFLRTSNRRVYAIGDCTGGPQFTHVAGYHAGIVIRSALFRLPTKTDHSAVPRVTYTDPGLAQVGLTESQAREKYGNGIHVVSLSLDENDRAQAERQTHGLIKAVIAKNGRILGCGISGPKADELIQVWILALSQKLKIGAIATMIMPYPTFGEVSKRAAGMYFSPKLFSAPTRALVRFLSLFG